MIKLAVVGCKRNNHHSGICGQAPSDYPEVTESSVTLGIDSMSPNPDRFLNAIRDIGILEKASLLSR